jgi:hypothetical protein
MQKVLILLALLLYWAGCDSGGKIYVPQTRDTPALETTSVDETDEEVTQEEEDDNNIISAYTTPDYVQIMEISALFTEGVALDIALSHDGDFAYIATGDKGLTVVDVSDPYHPEVIDRYDTPQYVNHVDVVDGKVYLSYKAQEWGDYVSVSAFDVSDPYAIRYLGHYEGFRKNNHKLYTLDGLIYYIDNEGFKVVRQDDYTVVGRYDLFDTAYAFVIRDGFAFVANGRNGLTVLKLGR